jgi:hypothetical protein
MRFSVSALITVAAVGVSLVSPMDVLSDRLTCTFPTQETAENTWFIGEKKDVKAQAMACSLSDTTTGGGEKVSERGLFARQTNVCGTECAFFPS